MKDNGLGCMAGDCITGNYYSTIFHAEAGQTYYLSVDGDDNQSFSYTVSLLTPQATETTCADDLDNDGDGLIDCDDSDCALDAACQTEPCKNWTALDCNTRLLAGDTGSMGNGTISEYSCMPQLSLGHPEVGYTFSYDTGPDTREVLLTLSNESDYATVSALNDLQVVETDITIKNGSNSAWSEGLLALKELVKPGAAPRTGQPEYYTTAFANDACDLSDAHCGAGCNDDGNATVLAKRHGLTIGTDAWIVPPLAKGASATVRIKAKADKELSYVARVVGSSDDLVAMHVLGNRNDLSVPLSDANGDGLDQIKFDISGFDVNSRSSSDGNGDSCSAQCPPPRTRCFVAPNNGTTGGAQPGGQSVANEVQCNPNQCIGGNFYAAKFQAKKGKQYFVTVEGAYNPDVSYSLSVICDPGPTESNCSDNIDEDGDYAIDCQDPDCDAACSQANTCQAADTIDCSTRRLQGTTSAPLATDAVDHSDCSPGTLMAGPEYAYTSVATESEWVNFTTSNIDRVVSVAVVEDTGTCDPHYCLDAQYYGAVVYVEAGKTYYVIVDGMTAGVTANYELSAVCNPPFSETVCDDQIDNDGDRLADCYDPDCGCP